MIRERRLSEPNTETAGENGNYVRRLAQLETENTYRLIELGYRPESYSRERIKHMGHREKVELAKAITHVIRSTYTDDKGNYLYPLPINDHTGTLRELDSGRFHPRLIWDRDGNPVALSATIERDDGWIELGRTGKVRGSLSEEGATISPILTGRFTDAISNRNGEKDRNNYGFYSEIRMVGDRQDGILSGRWIQKRFLSEPSEENLGYGCDIAGFGYIYCVGGNEPFAHVVKPFSRSHFKEINKDEIVVMPNGVHESLVSAIYENMGLNPDNIDFQKSSSTSDNRMWLAHIPPNPDKIYWQVAPTSLAEINQDMDLLTAVNNGEARFGTLEGISDIRGDSPFLLAKLPADDEGARRAQELLDIGMHVCGIMPKIEVNDKTKIILGRFGDKAKEHGAYQPQLLKDLYDPKLYNELTALDTRLRADL